MINVAFGSEEFQGNQILEGFKKVALHLLTPNGENVEITEKKFHKFQALRYDPDASSYFDVFPEYVATLEDGMEHNFEGACFKKISIDFQKLEDQSVEIVVNLDEAESLLCREAMIFATDTQFFVEDYLLR